ncbi:MAG: LysM peptidoglycan-binding domain-containing protein [Lachnospiraceae bacterium]|nr:LysM peptidoglycan-binding domain-containing protein [Lachnospiraceae bacterium]
MIHVVNAGDTLFSIGERYGVEPALLAEINGIEVWQSLVVGQAILVLKPLVTVTVEEGDTLYSIAERFGVPILQLLRNNPSITESFNIFEGSTLVVSYEDESIKGMIVNGYAYPFIDDLLLREALPYMSFLTVFTYGINDDGTLIGIDDERVIEIARGYGVRPIMLISTLTAQGVFSNALAHEILNDEAKLNTLIESIVSNISDKNYGGLDVDFEFVYAEDKEKYADFIRRLRDRLNPLGYPVIVALAPKYIDDQTGLIYEGHDYTLLGEAANYALIMAYEWGYTYGPPLAVAPLNEVRRVLDYGVSRIPREKIFMGIPNYGYDWTLPYVRGETRAKSISNPEAVDIARRYGAQIMYDEDAESPYFNYTDEEGREHIVWFEDARSIDAKLRLAAEYGFAGISYWNIMRPFTANWMIVNDLYNIERTL